MKKLALLLAICAMGTISAMSQGNIAFQNNGTGQLITINTGSSNAPIGGNNAAAAGLGAGPGQVNFRLYVGTNGNAVTFDSSGLPTSGLVLVGTTTNLGSVAAGAVGLFNGGNPYQLSAPFDGSFQIEFYYWAQTQNGNYIGHSALGTAYTLATGVSPTTATFGVGAGQVTGFTLQLVPEPSTIALGGLGVASLLLFRRRK